MKSLSFSKQYAWTSVRERSSQCLGFTLIESVIALGVFAFAVAIIIELFLSGTSRLREVQDRAQATQLIPSINATLETIGWNADSNYGKIGVEELTAGGAFELVANSDASRVTLQDQGVGLNEMEQYYLIVVQRYEEGAHRFGRDLRGVMVLTVKVCWPYRMPATGGEGYVETDESVRKTFNFLSTLRP